MRSNRGRKPPELDHYMRFDDSGEIHFLFDEKEKMEWDSNVTQKYLKKLQKKLKEMRNK